MTATVTSAIERYIDAVRAELADLGVEERADMLEDVEQHLLEVAAEGDEPLESRLGPPVEYAAELRAAAGLPPKPTDDDMPAGSLAARASRRLDALQRRVTSVPGYRETATFAKSLRPGWWVLRAYFVALALGAAMSSYPHGLTVIPRLWDSKLAGVIALILLVWASVAWSRAAEHRRGLTALTVAGNVAVIGAMLFLANHENTLRAQYGPSYGVEATANAYQVGLALDGKPITNIYPYAADGKPLDGVLLYDQDGQPILLPEQPQRSTVYSYTMPPRSSPSNGNGFPHSEPIYDPMTGAKIGERQRPVVIVPTASSNPTPSASSSELPAQTPTSAPSADPTSR